MQVTRSCYYVYLRKKPEAREVCRTRGEKSAGMFQSEPSAIWFMANLEAVKNGAFSSSQIDEGTGIKSDSAQEFLFLERTDSRHGARVSPSLNACKPLCFKQQ